MDAPENPGIGTPGGGLTAAEASRRLAESGPNEIRKPRQVRFLAIVREEVTAPMILLLLFVGVVYSFSGRPEDAITIFVVIALLVFAEVWNEYRAKKAITDLTALTAPKARVRRDGALVELPAVDVVPGDELALTAGTLVAADAEVGATVTGLQVDESALTGESLPVAAGPGDHVFAGTVVESGEGAAVVTATGAATRLGKIASAAAAIRAPRTPLQLAMRRLAGILVYVAVFFSVIIPVIGVAEGQPLRTMILTGLALSFATIPEELPIIITMVLGLGSYRLSRRGFLVKRLVAAETMGSATVIVTDKTGTLTESRMTVAAVTPHEARASVLAAAAATVTPLQDSALDAAVRAAAEGAGARASGVLLRARELGQGGPTKAALRDDGGLALYVSGAPEAVFAECAGVSPEIREALQRETDAGRRVIAAASRLVPAAERDAPFDVLERGMTLAGLVAFADPLRAGVPETVAEVREAGIRTIMVTGDHPATAAAIAADAGLERAGHVVTGAELDGMDERALASAVREVDVFARATPQHKYRIVEALQSQGEVVAVTGDGVNDALALQAADIGIAMGRRGTDVAKSAADVVLADDDYVTIAAGVFEGRVFRDNLRKGVTYYLAVKLALVLIFLLPVLARLPLPFAPIQIILLELFMDLAASAGFVAEPAERGVRTRRPPRRTSNLFGPPQLVDLGIKAVLLFVAVTGVYLAARALVPAEARTLAFAAWMAGHVTLAFTSRSDTDWLLRMGPFRNRVIDAWALAAAAVLLVGVYVPAVGSLLFLVPVPFGHLLAAVGVAVVVVGLAELRKAFPRLVTSLPDQQRAG